MPPPDPAYLESRSHTPRGTQRRNVPSGSRPPPQTDIFDDMAGVLLFGPRAVGGLFQHIGEQSSKKVAAQALTVLFKLVHDLFIDKKYTPERLQKPVDGLIRNLQRDIVKNIRSDSAATRELKEHICEHRASAYLGVRAGPWHWVRCRVLHFFMPADETAWFTVQRRGAWVAAPFFLVSWAGVQVWSFIALYLLIDKRDEFQVVNWVTTFKLFQFVFTGVAPFVWICFRVVRCALLAEEYPEHAIETANYYFHAPDGPEEVLFWAAAVARIVFVLEAFARLACGRNGGREQLEALEAVRVDGADGVLDGFLDVTGERQAPVAVRVKRTGSTEESAARDATHVWLWRDEAALWAYYTKMYRHHRQNARAAHQLPVDDKTGKEKIRDGGPFVKFLMGWEVAILLLSIALHFGCVRAAQYDLDEWKYWLFLEIALTTHSVLSFPYLAFAVLPTKLLTGTAATGYDKHGWLCQALNMDEVEKVREKNAKESAARKRTVTHNPHIGVFGTWGKTDKKRQLKSLVG